MMSCFWPLPETFRIRLTMESDWHVGSGMGRPGNVDRLIVRDADGLPFVPAKTLRGIWRDACEQLCRGLDNGQDGPWSHLVARLFGGQPRLVADRVDQDAADVTSSRLGSAIEIRPARIPGSLRQQLVAADREIRQALTFIKPGVKIDRRTGAAETDCLRFEEVARKGTVLEADCRLTVVDPAGREIASALLIASAHFVERLGGKRRRGAGRCRLEILGADRQKAIDFLREHFEPPAWSPPSKETIRSEAPHPAPEEDPWIVVPLRIQLLSPILAAYRTVGNVIESLDYLPGTSLLPHVSRALSQYFPPLEPIRRGEIIVLNATPEIQQQRSWPVPKVFAHLKTDKNRWLNRAIPAESLEKPTRPDQPHQGPHRADSGEEQYKPVREGYVSPDSPESGIAWCKVEKTIRTHNTVRDDLQRPDESVGGVYTYEAIAPGTKEHPVFFRSEVRIRKSLLDLASENWWQQLSGRVALGRSSRDDYGDVEITAEAPREAAHPLGSAPEGELRVWLLSDCLLRNDRLQYDPRPETLAEELSRLLGCQLELCSSGDAIAVAARTSRLESWHGRWSMPRPSLIGLEAGSCFRFRVHGSLDPAKLARLEIRGIGHRKAEGFGQVCFNHSLLRERSPKVHAITAATASRTNPNKEPLASEETQIMSFARLIERECWKQKIRRRCLEIAANRREFLGWVARGEQGQPPMSQLGALRGQLSMLRTPTDRSPILKWLKHLGQNNRRKEKWPNGSIEYVRAIIESDDRIWEIVNPEGWPVLTAKAQSELKRELWALAVRTFFDACIRAHKRELESQQTKEAGRGA